MLQPLSPQKSASLYPASIYTVGRAAPDAALTGVVPANPLSGTDSSVGETTDTGVFPQKGRALAPETHSPADAVRLSAEARELAKLAERDREVRTHEAAHAAVGGPYAGSPSLTYKSGPDGRSYAVGGEVSIDVSPVAGDPLATLEKAQTVRAAALAPAQPSAQDMRVAARAMQMAAQAYAELSAQSNNDATGLASEAGSGHQQRPNSSTTPDSFAPSLDPIGSSGSLSPSQGRASLSIRL